MRILNQTLEEHEKIIDEHDSELCGIKQDLVDIKTRLGIKDLTNGQVVEYQKLLSKAFVDERNERKESDNQLREDVKRLDDKTWMILTGVVLSILLEIGFMLVKGGV